MRQGLAGWVHCTGETGTHWPSLHWATVQRSPLSHCEPSTETTHDPELQVRQVPHRPFWHMPPQPSGAPQAAVAQSGLQVGLGVPEPFFFFFLRFFLRRFASDSGAASSGTPPAATSAASRCPSLRRGAAVARARMRASKC